MRTHPSRGTLPDTPAGYPSKPPARRKAGQPAAAPPRPPAAFTQEQVARRAYEIYQARGDSDGDALSDWLAAERELCERADASACVPGRTEGDVYH